MSASRPGRRQTSRIHLVLAVAALVVSLSPSLAAAGERRPGDDEFGYCDAKLLAEAWSTSVTEAKATLSRKVANGDADLVRQALTERLGDAFAAGSVCHAMTDSNIHYTDVEVLAAYWATSEQEALVRISSKLAFHDYVTLDEELGRAYGAPAGAATALGGHPAPSGSAVDYDAWLDSNYQSCDAELLAEAWGVETGEAKGLIGAKVAGGLTAALDETLGPLREQARRAGRFCYVDTSLSQPDLERLAREHYETSVDQARRLADEEMSKGRNARDAVVELAHQLRPEGEVPPTADPFGF